MPQPLHCQLQHLMLDFDVEHSPDQVPFCRPKMKQTLVALAGNGIFRLRQVKYCSAVIEHDGVPSSCEKVLSRASQGLESHNWNAFIFIPVCDV